MQKYIEFLKKFKWFIVLGLPLIVIFLASNLKYLEIDGSYRIWFGEDSKILKDYDNFRRTFGNDDGVVIVFKDKKGIFTKKALQSIDNITQALWQTKYIARVDSITNYQHVHAGVEDPDDIVVEDFIQEIPTASATYLADRKHIATTDPLLIDSFISKDGTTTMISARLVPKVNDKSDKSLEIMDVILRLLIEKLLIFTVTNLIY